MITGLKIRKGDAEVDHKEFSSSEIPLYEIAIEETRLGTAVKTHAE